MLPKEVLEKLALVHMKKVAVEQSVDIDESVLKAIVSADNLLLFCNHPDEFRDVYKTSAGGYLFRVSL